ncbi:MAG: hypothetical protein AAF721_04635 [Myxococcota bacterium]
MVTTRGRVAVGLAAPGLAALGFAAVALGRAWSVGEQRKHSARPGTTSLDIGLIETGRYDL